MHNPVQLSLFDTSPKQNGKRRTAEWGTFKDSLRAPIHRWFTYPAGFSYKAVEHSLDRYDIQPGQTIYDPFMGSGTTNLVAKSWGIHSYGVEAHPFVYRIAQAKMNWHVERADVLTFIKYVQEKLPAQVRQLKDSCQLTKEFPELILKCYEPQTIYDLWALRDIAQNSEMDMSLGNFFFVVITALLREVSTAATGWPYIAPKKKKVTSLDKDVLTEFGRLARQMSDDIETMREAAQDYTSQHILINAESQDTKTYIADCAVDHVFTSPPYLNNFDYADRTRLELYFWGEAKTWGDISDNIRTKLMTSATTQINRTDPKYEITADLRTDCPDVTQFLETAVAELGERRKHKGGKKSYDLMVAGYFNDIHQIIKDVYRVLKPHTKALFVLGDSAPYGVHIPTDELIGKIGVDIGFSSYDIEILRTRGGKWAKNPQRHSVKLRESIVILSKE